jgi:cytochrome c-type biogenesis protein
MIDSPGISLAFAAGVISFVSPCCLPLVPGYLAAVSGTSPDASARRFDWRVLGRAGLFVGTFSLIFVLLGLSASAAGALLSDNIDTLNLFAGVAIIVMGVLFIASVFVTRLNRDWRPAGLIDRAGSGGPIVAGAAFAIAWTPCVGPTLAAILSLAATSEGAASGGLLLAGYSAGLALPFILSALAFSAATRSFTFLKRHYAAIQVGAGIVMILMGYLVITDQLFRLNIEAMRLMEQLGLDFYNAL